MDMSSRAPKRGTHLSGPQIKTIENRTYGIGYILGICVDHLPK
jgi:hypothetical protein